MLNRVSKVGQRFREVEGKTFTKISEEKIIHEELVHELEESVKEFSADPKVTKLAEQKLQSQLIRQKRLQKQIK